MSTEIVLDANEQAKVAGILDDLHQSGYRDIEAHGSLCVGARIRHSGHRWPEAYERGTGVVLAITEKPDSAWSRSWGKPDVELIAVWDTPTFGIRVSQLAQYHVAVIEGAS